MALSLAQGKTLGLWQVPLACQRGPREMDAPQPMRKEDLLWRCWR